MKFKTLGNTGVMVPEIGLGTWNYRGGVEPLRKGIELGATLIDTAEGYYTEDVVGEAVKEIRDQVFIATKVSGRHLSYDGVLKAAEGSLIQIETDYIDLYQIHWPNPSYPISETMKAMEKLADKGLITHIGVSNFSIEEIVEAQSYLRNYKIVSNQVLYNLNSREIEYDLLPYCQKHQITIMAYTPLDNGSLAKGSSLFKRNRLKVLEQIASETNKTMAQVALNWCISQPYVIAIPKSDSVRRTIENCGASGWRLSPEQVDRLNEASS
jgi:diketogulonate reductase-like aldo/keto reductase